VGLLAVAALLAACLLGGCGGGGGGEDDQRIKVVATTDWIADIVLNVGRGDVDVYTLSGPGQSPHEHRTTPQDLAALADADVVFSSGAGLDLWARDALEEAGGDAPVIDLGAAVLLRQRRNGLDPHWWMDPMNVRAAIGKVRDGLTQADPSKGRQFKRDALTYADQIVRLDEALRRCYAQLPRSQRRFDVVHNAWGYLAARYGLRVVDRERVSVPGLYGDSLGPAGSGASTYISAQAHNAERLVSALSDGRLHCRVRLQR
jgi:zinc/manganese transport system substrate-binding protein